MPSLDTGGTQREMAEATLLDAQGSGEHCRPCSAEACGVPFLLLQKSVGDRREGTIDRPGAVTSSRPAASRGLVPWVHSSARSAF